MIDVLSLYREHIQELWGLGLTVVPREITGDPFHVNPAIIPQGRSYQWLPVEKDRLAHQDHDDDWRPVCYEDHPGHFAPYGTSGEVMTCGMKLCWKPKKDVEVARAKDRAKALDLEMEWERRFSQHGITGGARRVIFGDTEVAVTEITMGKTSGVETVARPQEKTIELVSEIPRDMQAYVGAIFEERDRLVQEVVRPDRTLAPGEIADKFWDAISADKSAPWWPALHAVILPYAIANVRKAVFNPAPEETQ